MAESVKKFSAEGAQLAELVVAEIAHVDGVTAVRGRANYFAEAIDIGSRPERGQGHYLAFIAKNGEPQVLGDKSVNQAHRVHDLGRPLAFQPSAAAKIGAAR